MKSARSRLLLGMVLLALIGLFVFLTTHTAPRFPTFPPEERTEGAEAPTRDLIQAAMIHRILENHVVWPDPRPELPLRLGIVGRNPLHEWKAESFRTIVCRTEQDLRDCRAVFVSKEAEREIERIAGIMRGRPVLILGEEAEALKRGAMVTFLLVEGKVKVRLSAEALGAAGLDVSDDLKRLAN